MQVLPTVATSEWPDQNSVQASERVDTPLDQIHFDGSTVPPLPHPEALLTDPFGWNTALRRKGIALLMDNTNEFTGAITKPTPGYGLRQGSSNAGQYSFETDIDWEKLAGVRGFSTHTVMVGRYGIPASRMFGDNLNPSSEIYGAGGNVVVHLVYAYGEETLAHGHFDIVAGRIPFLNDFSSNPLYCTFMNNAFCGNPKAAGENTAHSSYPDGVWATRVRVRPTTHTYIQAGVYFSQAGIYGNTQYRTGFKFNGADINGESIPVERARPIGMLKMEDESGQDEKIICVPHDKIHPQFTDVQSIHDLPKITLRAIEHFFERYKDLEPNKWVKVSGWADKEEAGKAILAALAAAK